MYQAAGMEVFEGGEQLPEDIAVMHVQQNVRANDRVDVGLEAFENHVDIGIVLGAMDAEEAHDKGMVVELFQKRYFAIGALGVRCVLECPENFLQGNNLLSLLVHNTPDNTVRTFADLLHDFISAENSAIDGFDVGMLRLRHDNEFGNFLAAF
jgi:hypothetical protein